MSVTTTYSSSLRQLNERRSIIQLMIDDGRILLNVIDGKIVVTKADRLAVFVLSFHS